MKLNWGQFPQCVVTSLLVVLLHPPPRDLPHLIEAGEQVYAQHLSPVGAIKSFNECVLVRLSRLDVVDEYSMVITPGREVAAEKFWAVVGP